jgi:hypothetical protein
MGECVRAYLRTIYPLVYPTDYGTVVYPYRHPTLPRGRVTTVPYTVAHVYWLPNVVLKRSTSWTPLTTSKT